MEKDRFHNFIIITELGIEGHKTAHFIALRKKEWKKGKKGSVKKHFHSSQSMLIVRLSK